MSTKIVKITNTIVRKNNDGWNAKTYFNIVGGNHDGRQVKVSTYKGGRGLYTSAQVMTIKSESGYQTESFEIFGDPSKTLVQPVKCRVTDASVSDQHKQAIEILEADGGAEWIK
jgi:hypothetical protein